MTAAYRNEPEGLRVWLEALADDGPCVDYGKYLLGVLYELDESDADEQSIGAYRPPMEQNPFMTVAETATLLGKSPWRVYQLARTGEIPSTRVGGRIVVPRAAFDQWLEKTSERALAAERYYLNDKARLHGC